MLGSSSLLGTVAFAVQTACGLRIPVRAALAPRSRLSPSKGLTLSPVSNAAKSTGDASAFELTDFFNNAYTTNVTLGGSVFTVQVDTGSTDLVLFPDQPVQTTLVILDHQANTSYGDGSYIAGPVAFAKLEFGEYSVESQVFLNGTSQSGNEPLFDAGVRGIMGVALDSAGSRVRDSLDEVYGTKESRMLSRNALGNVFQQSPDLGNFTTVYLNRTGDGEATDGGIFAIGEYIEGTEDGFKNAKSIDVFDTTQWGFPIDAVTVNGKKVTLNSTVKGAPSGKAIALLDTGTSLALVPEYVLDAMYSAFAGATFNNGTWIVPCLNGAPNITFTFGGQEFYISPLDLTNVQDSRPDANYTMCTPSFSAFSGVPGLDIILGDSFLRNVYSAFDYGSFSEDGDVIKSPSVKLLSLSPSNVSYSEYLTSRANTLASLPPQTTSPSQELNTGTSDGDGAADVVTNDANLLSSGSTSSSSSDDASYQALVDKLDAFGPVVVGLLGTILATLTGLLAIGAIVYIRRGRSAGIVRNVGPSYAPVPVRSKEPDVVYTDETPSLGYNE